MVGAWAFAEAILWVVVPDVLLLALGVARPEGAVRRALVSLVFSLLGITVMWVLCLHLPMQSMVYELPWTYPKMGEQVAKVVQSDGVWVALGQPSSTIPVKVWVLVATHDKRWPLPAFLLFVGLARGTRMLAFSWLGAALGRRWRGLASKRGLMIYLILVWFALNSLAGRYL